jgi:nucleoid-associated protein YgaU
MAITGRGILGGAVLLVVLTVVTVDRYRHAMARRAAGHLRREAPSEPARESPPETRPLDPDDDAVLVIRLGGARIPPAPPGESPASGEAAAEAGAGSPSRPSSSGEASSPPPSVPSRPTPPAGTEIVEHTVAPGETLGEIAQRYLGSYEKWKVIAERNGITDARKVQAGRKLVIPLDAAGR